MSVWRCFLALRSSKSETTRKKNADSTCMHLEMPRLVIYTSDILPATLVIDTEGAEGSLARKTCKLRRKAFCLSWEGFVSIFSTGVKTAACHCLTSTWLSKFSLISNPLNSYEYPSGLYWVKFKDNQFKMFHILLELTIIMKSQILLH